jgi:diaminopimelate decarboxylase
MNLQTLALHYPTPFFAYNSATILDRVRELTTAFEGMPESKENEMASA